MDLDLSGLTEAHDVGDHFLVFHRAHGAIPAFKTDLTPEQSSHLQHMACGGMVQGYAKGGEVEQTSNDPGMSQMPRPAVSQGPADVPVQASFPPYLSPEDAASVVPADFSPIVPRREDLRLTSYNNYVGTVPAGMEPYSFDQWKGAVERTQIERARQAEAARIEASKHGVAATAAWERSQTEAPPPPPGFEAPGAPSVSSTTLPVSPAQSPPVPAEASPGTQAAAAANAVPASTAARRPAGPDALSSAFGEQKAGLEAKAAADTELAAANLTTQNNFLKDIRQIQKDYLESLEKSQARQRELMSTNIDPQRYLRQMGAFDRTMTAVGLFLSGFGSGLLGRPDDGLAYLKSAIEQDINAQERQQDRDLKLNQMEQGALRDTFDIRRADAQTLVANMLQQDALKLAPKMNEALLKGAIGRLGEDSVKTRVDVSNKEMQNRVNAAQIRKMDSETVNAANAASSWRQSLAPIVQGKPNAVRDAALRRILSDPKLVGEHFIRIRKVPPLRAGIPITDASGMPINPGTEESFTIQSKDQETPKKFEALDTLQDSLGRLAGFAEKYPEGTNIHLGDASAIDALRKNMTAQLNVAQEQGAISHGDAERSEGQIAQISFGKGLTGSTGTVLRSLQDFLTSKRNALVRNHLLTGGE